MKFLVRFLGLFFLWGVCCASPFDDPHGFFSVEHCEQSSYRLHYASVETVKKAIAQSGLLAQAHAWLVWDARLNSLFFCALRKKLSAVRHLISVLDQPIKQIKVGVKIVSVDEDWLEALGVQWDFQGADSDAVHSFLLMKSSLGLKILSQISAKNQKNRAEVVASPTLVTSNNQAAFIESGEKIPYQERDHDGNLSTVFKDALLRLSITPTLLPKGNIHLKVNLHYDKVSSFAVAGMPVIRAQQLQTDIVTHMGHLLVLGGIIESRQERIRERVPFLSKIPVLGHAFRYSKHSSGKKQLLVFLYPEEV